MYSQIADNIVGGPFLEKLALPAVATGSRVANAPGMLSYMERAMLYALCRDVYRGHGAIIDGGSFFGSSLVACASGLEANPKFDDMDFSTFGDGKPIHAYELGFLPAPAAKNVDRNRVYGGVEYVLGESFVPILEENAAPHRDIVSLHIGDLKDKRWGGAPIEIAFIDVCKTIRLNAHVSSQFFSAMIGGSSVLINQDFFFDRLPWIKVTMGFMRDYFRWEGQVHTSSVYTNTKAVPRDVAEYDPFTEGTYDECLAWHDATAFPGLGRRYLYFCLYPRHI